MTPTLLVLAAGMGSRYGGLKQIEPMGPGGETVLDYSVYDAIRAGFTRVVFIIREEFSEAFKNQLGAKFADKIEVAYCYQDLHDLPGNFTLPEGRTKPWGTSHAILTARHLIQSHFAVINADDFYGRDSYQQITSYFKENHTHSGDKDHYCMVGYELENTLSNHGSVNRGICTVTSGFLQTVEEHTGILVEADGICRGQNLACNRVEIAPTAIASMNFWGFSSSLMQHLEEHFIAFLKLHGNEMTSECYIPSVVDHLLASGNADCNILSTTSSWFGVTYPEDKISCMASIKDLIKEGEYPANLWA